MQRPHAVQEDSRRVDGEGGGGLANLHINASGPVCLMRLTDQAFVDPVQFAYTCLHSIAQTKVPICSPRPGQTFQSRPSCLYVLSVPTSFPILSSTKPTPLFHRGPPSPPPPPHSINGVRWPVPRWACASPMTSLRDNCGSVGRASCYLLLPSWPSPSTQETTHPPTHLTPTCPDKSGHTKQNRHP